MRYFAILFLLLISYKVFSQSTRKIIKHTDELIELKQYQSAFEYLNEKDPDNINEELVLKKVFIALNYYTHSEDHHKFSFNNLPENQHLEDLRKKKIIAKSFAFDIPDILDRLYEQRNDNIKILRALGDFYFDAYSLYPEIWLQEEPFLLQKIRNYYETVLQEDETNEQIYYRIGYSYLVEQKYESALPYFQQAIQFNDNNPTAHYNLSYALISLERFDEAHRHAQKALEQYSEDILKADAARMLALISKEKGDNFYALKYIDESDLLDPKNYFTLRLKLELEISIKHLDNAARTIESFYRLDPENPTIYNDLVDIYLEYHLEDQLLTFLNYKLQNKKSNSKIAGNIYFYTGYINMYKKNKYEARKNFSAAKNSFEKVYLPDDQVFVLIDHYLSELN